MAAVAISFKMARSSPPDKKAATKKSQSKKYQFDFLDYFM
jgi:hypothetical protein